MFERYTEKARRVIFFARYEASNFFSPDIEPEHILLALLREDSEIFRHLSPRDDLILEIIRHEIQAALSPGQDRANASVDLPLSQSSRQSLQFAAEESERLNSRHIGTQHLLLGLLKEGNSIASRILTERGISYERVIDLVTVREIDSSSDMNQAQAIPSVNLLYSLIDRLVRERVVSPQNLIDEIAARYSSPPQRLQFQSLLDLLVRKGVISENDRQSIIGSVQ